MLIFLSCKSDAGDEAAERTKRPARIFAEQSSPAFTRIPVVAAVFRHLPAFRGTPGDPQTEAPWQRRRQQRGCMPTVRIRVIVPEGSTAETVTVSCLSR